MRPRIGITTALEGNEQRLDLRYVRAVERAGGLPVIVPVLDEEAETREFAAMLDGLVVIGGPGMVLGLTGKLAPELAPVADLRGRADARILSAFLERSRPALGICYGMQLANALLGGTIYGDVERQVPGALVHSDRRGGQAHRVGVLSNTHLRRILGTDGLEVPTHHLQSVCAVGNGLTVSAVAPDGVIEAVESADGSFIGVQFHPERMGDEVAPLFAHLVECARAKANERLTIPTA